MNDLTKLDDVLSAIVVKGPKPMLRPSKHLCADAGYRSKATACIIDSHGYIAHVVDRRQEQERKWRDAKKKARRWVLEVCHRWFNRFRRLLVRYEKLERSFVALNHVAAATVAFRKVPLKVNITCASALSVDASEATLKTCHARNPSDEAEPRGEFTALVVQAAVVGQASDLGVAPQRRWVRPAYLRQPRPPRVPMIAIARQRFSSRLTVPSRVDQACCRWSALSGLPVASSPSTASFS